MKGDKVFPGAWWAETKRQLNLRGNAEVSYMRIVLVKTISVWNKKKNL